MKSYGESSTITLVIPSLANRRYAFLQVLNGWHQKREPLRLVLRRDRPVLTIYLAQSMSLSLAASASAHSF